MCISECTCVGVIWCAICITISDEFSRYIHLSPYYYIDNECVNKFSSTAHTHTCAIPSLYLIMRLKTYAVFVLHRALSTHCEYGIFHVFFSRNVCAWILASCKSSVSFKRHTLNSFSSMREREEGEREKEKHEAKRRQHFYYINILPTNRGRKKMA